MIIIPILLALFTGLLILRLCNLHKQINIFEQVALGFVSALSLFIFEIFLQGIIFDKLSLLLPIITFVICLGLFVYKCIKVKGFGTGLIGSIKGNFSDIKDQFKSLKIRQKILVCIFCIYALAKCFIAFGINLHMPTFDEDAVVGWDLKTKVYTENKSLVLDKENPEYLGSAYERNIFAPLTDTYFLLASDGININQTDIISPIIYLLSVLVLFGIFLRKGNLLFASLSGYLFTSLPFIFIHGFGSYFNFISGVFLFIFIFYFIDQLLEKNKNIIIPLSLLGFLTTTIRNESFILIIAIVIITILCYYFMNKNNKINYKELLKNIGIIVGSLIIGIICLKYSTSLSPSNTSLNIGGIGMEDSNGIVSIFMNNLFNEGLLKYFFQQAFYHPDYNIIFITLILLLIFAVIKKIKHKEYIFMLLAFLTLLGGTVAILIYNYENLGLITHYGFIRFSTVYIIFMVYLVGYIGYLLHNNFRN